MPLLSNIVLKFGTSPGQTPLVLPAASVTLLIGPNNSGKSLLLKEVNDFLRENRRANEFKILNTLEFDPSSLPEAVAEIQSNLTTTLQNSRSAADHVFYVMNGGQEQFHLPGLNAWISNPTTNNPHYHAYAKHATIKLDGPSRIALVNEKPLGDLMHPPSNRLEQLFQNDTARSELRAVIFESLKTYLVVDPTKPGHVRLRLSPTAPPSGQIERGIHQESIDFHKLALPIEEASDGIKAFCGILLELFAGNPRALLIDEPEAFLHPSLAFMLGKAAASRAHATGKQLVISTHSGSFLMGCMQSGAPVNVVRLTYSGGVGTARLLPSADLFHFMRNPLLRSVGVINGLFYVGVVVTEADSDRAFYNEINERLLLAGGRGIANCLFLNAQGKHTVPEILKLLRSLGIPAAGILDIDALKEGGTNWQKFLTSAGFSAAEVTALDTSRLAAVAALNAAGDMKTAGGLALLVGTNLQTATTLVETLDHKGLFLVRGGEVESWLPQYGNNQHGPKWLIPMFESLGENPADPNFVHAGTGDVWEFMDNVGKWISNPSRQGLQP